MTTLDQAAEQRIRTILDTSEEHRQAFAQHLTPPETAELAVSLFSDTSGELRCLDLGAGTGMLSVALIDRYGEKITRMDAVEKDPKLAEVYAQSFAAKQFGELVIADALTETPNRRYDRVILNPPYKKMSSTDLRQKTLPCHSANIYSAFLSIALKRLAPGGEAVAIIPRSWMNGNYFMPFRKWAMKNYSLDIIHIYESRSEVFSDTDVLQETMIARFSNRPQSKIISVSHSSGKVGEVKRFEYRAEDLISDDGEYIIRIAPHDGTLKSTMEKIGLRPSTGKVVDFRSRDRIYADNPKIDGIYRLVYAGNFSKGTFIHPMTFGKGQWFRADDATSRRQLIEKGNYVVVKRFSAKEEKRRVVAYPLISKEAIAIENHLNYIHAGTSRETIPLSSRELAYGITIWLNSTYIDEWFRNVSGSTQVNAGDIKKMPTPSIKLLEELGQSWHSDIDQEEIDRLCKRLE